MPGRRSCCRPIGEAHFAFDPQSFCADQMFCRPGSKRRLSVCNGLLKIRRTARRRPPDRPARPPAQSPPPHRPLPAKRRGAAACGTLREAEENSVLSHKIRRPPAAENAPKIYFSNPLDAGQTACYIYVDALKNRGQTVGGILFKSPDNRPAKSRRSGPPTAMFQHTICQPI